MASNWNTAHRNVWAYRYNQPVNPRVDPATEHAAENFMMFRGTSTGYVLINFHIVSTRLF